MSLLPVNRQYKAKAIKSTFDSLEEKWQLAQSKSDGLPKHPVS